LLQICKIEKTDSPQGGTYRLRAAADFSNRIKLICPVQSSREKHSA
jgi:hypothetical protein